MEEIPVEILKQTYVLHDTVFGINIVIIQPSVLVAISYRHCFQMKKKNVALIQDSQTHCC